jgi:hypothetical protein
MGAQDKHGHAPKGRDLMHKRTRRILTGVGIVLVSVGAVYAVMLAKSTTRLRQAYAALENDRRTMLPAEFIPPAVPDAQNAIVLYESAASMLKAQPVGAKNLLWHLGRLADSFWSDSPDPNDRAELKQLMGQKVVLSALSAIEQGTQCPACRLNRHYDTGVPAEMPMVDDLRPLGRLVSVKACLEAEAGEPNKAWNTMATQLRFADGLRLDPLCAGQLCRSGLIIRACSVIQRLCEIEPPRGENYERMEGLLKDLDDAGSLLRALDGERLLVGERLFNLSMDELYQTVRERVFRANDQTPEIATRLGFRVVVFKPRLVADHAMYLDLMGKFTRILQGPYVPRGSEARKEIDDLRAKSRLLTREFAPRPDLMVDLHYRSIAEVHMTRAGLALLQYRRVHGTFPPTLDALGLERLTDPYTQEPLHYRTQGEGFVVYSVGEDLKDNGGSPRQPKQTTDYDFVWCFPRPKSPRAASGH